MKPQTVWIALSAQGHPVPYIGFAYQRKLLEQRYRDHYGHSTDRAGYRLVKAKLVIEAKAK